VRILLDTPVLVAAMVESYPAHARALPWVQRVQDGVDIGLVAAHSLAELYAIFTTLPVQPRIPPAVAQQLINNILGRFKVVFLSDEDYIAVINHLSDLGIVGGATYDALILHAAVKANADRVVTLDEKDFLRVHSALADKIVSP